MIPNMPSKLSGDGGLNPTRENIAPIVSPNAPDCSADNNSDLFYATFGGIGLTGILIDIKIKLN